MRKGKDKTRKRPPALIFPELVFARDARIGKQGTRVKLFTLLWTDVDRKGELRSRTLPELSVRLRGAMDAQVFAVPHNYLAEIQRYEKMAVEEWGRSRGFDTSVNDECLNVAKECVYNIFYLLSDTLFRPVREDGKMTDRAITRTWADYGIAASWKCAMLFRFWQNQTGNAWVARNARVSELVDLKERMNTTGKKSRRRRLFTAFSDDEEKIVPFVLGELMKHPLAKMFGIRRRT